jgi:hypothetical protein
MLSEFLPARYQVTTGFVIDSTGAASEQIDIIIHDRQYSPFILPHDGAHHVPAESVYAILECKQDISKDELNYAAGKAASVRGLKRTSVPIAYAGGVYPPKKPGPILAGLCTLDSEWSPALDSTFRGHLSGLVGDRIIDLGCVLKHGAFQRATDGTISTSTQEAALVWFCVTLVSRLQGLGTVPALDLQAYLSSITASTPPSTS